MPPSSFTRGLPLLLLIWNSAFLLCDLNADNLCLKLSYIFFFILNDALPLPNYSNIIERICTSGLARKIYEDFNPLTQLPLCPPPPPPPPPPTLDETLVTMDIVAKSSKASMHEQEVRSCCSIDCSCAIRAQVRRVVDPCISSTHD